MVYVATDAARSVRRRQKSPELAVNLSRERLRSAGQAKTEVLAARWRHDRASLNSVALHDFRIRRRLLDHDPEKRIPVFRKIMLQQRARAR
jgi:hypothetical protein